MIQLYNITSFRTSWKVLQPDPVQNLPEEPASKHFGTSPATFTEPARNLLA